MHKFRALDGYRAIAALLVVTTHVSFSTGYVTSRPWGAAFARFDIGVAIFFLLSGFLLFRRWSSRAMDGQPAPRTRTYLRRRFWRILPAFWVVVLVVFLVLPTVDATPVQILTNFTLVQMYGEGWQVFGLTQMWSLGVEAVFYLFLPIAGWLVARRGRGDVARSTNWQLTVLGSLFVVGVAFTALRTIGPLRSQLGAGFWLPGFLDWFAIGMLAALVQVRLTKGQAPRWMIRLRDLAADPTSCLILTLGLFLIAATPLAGSYTLLGNDPTGELIRHLIYPITAFFFLLPGFLADTGQGLWLRFLHHPAMQFLGMISYGIFLWHLLVRDLLAYYLGINDFSGGIAWMLPLTVAITIMIAYLSWIIIERPCIAYSHGPGLRTRWRRRRATKTSNPDTTDNNTAQSTANV